MKKMLLAMTILGLAAATLVPTAKADGYYGRYYGRGGYYHGAPYRGGYYRGGYYAPRAVVGFPVPAPVVCAPGVAIAPPVVCAPPVVAAPSVRIGLPLPPLPLLPLPGFHGFFRGPFGFFHHGHR